MSADFDHELSPLHTHFALMDRAKRAWEAAAYAHAALLRMRSTVDLAQDQLKVAQKNLTTACALAAAARMR